MGVWALQLDDDRQALVGDAEEVDIAPPAVGLACSATAPGR
jgi:hypothetical protein